MVKIVNIYKTKLNENLDVITQKRVIKVYKYKYKKLI